MAKKNEKTNRVKKKEGKSFFERYRWGLIIFVFSVILYANAVPNDYNMDDELVTINHRLTSKGISAIPEIFTSTYYKDEMGYAYEYRPMVLASFAIEHQIFNDKPFVSHLINVLLYGLCCVLLFRVLLTVTAGFSVIVPLGITLLFVAYPAHTEVVSSIKNRDEILGLIFSFLACMAAFNADKKSNLWLIPVPLFFTAALMSKLSVLPFSLIIPLAIILFTNAGFKKVIAIAFMLALSSFIVLHNQLYEKLLMVFAMLTVSVMFFMFIRFSEFSAQVKSVLKSVLTEPAQFLRGQTENIVKADSMKFFDGVTFPFGSYWSLQPVAVAITAAFFYLTGIITGIPLIIAFGGVCFFILLIFGNEKAKWWAQVMLYSCLTLTIIKYPLSGTIYADFLTICLFYQILYGDRKLFIPSVIICFIWFLLVPTGGFVNIGVIILIFFRWKWTWPLAVVNAAGGIYSSFNELSKTGVFNALSFHSDNYAAYFALLLVISLLIHRGTRAIITACQILAVITLLTIKVIETPISPVNAKDKFKAQITQIGGKVNTNIIAEKLDRPIDFVEQPVTAKSAVQLRIGTAFEILFIYLHKVVLPYPMSFYYGYRFIEPENITDVVPLISLCLYAVLFLLAVFCLKRNKLIGFGLMIYLISIAAVSTYFSPIPGQLGERFLLVPSLGWCIVFVMGLSILFKTKITGPEVSVNTLPKPVKYSFTVLLCLYSVITFSRNFDWKDYTTIAKHDIDYVQNSSQANNLMALNMMKKSYESSDPMVQKAMRIEALAHFKKALEIYPRFYNVTYDIARVFNILNENDSSIRYFKKALALDSTNSNPALFIGQMLSEKGNFTEAIPYLQYAGRHAVDYQPFDKLSYAYFRVKDYKASIAANQTAISRFPGLPDPFINIARVYITLNQLDSANSYVQSAIRINPNDRNAQQVLQQITNSKMQQGR